MPGTFTWKDRDAWLELHDELERREVNSRPADRYPVIHGRLYTGELVSMLDALNAGPRPFPWAVSRVQKLTALHVVVGSHVDEGTPLTQFSARLPGLQHWLSRRWYTTEVAPVDDGRPHVTIVAKYPEVAIVNLADAKLQLSLDVLPEEKGQGGFVLSTMGRVTIIPTVPQPFGTLLEIFGRVAALLTMMSGGPISTDQILVALAGGGLDSSVLLSLRNSETCTFTEEDQFFLVERTLGTSLSEALTRWFDVYSNIDLPSRLAVDVLNDEGNTHLDFLGVMQALEGFHRGLNRPAPGVRVTLRERLLSLAEVIPDDIRRKIIGHDFGVVGKWVKARNAYSHWDVTLMPDAIDGMELISAIRRLKMLLRVSYRKRSSRHVPCGRVYLALGGVSRQGSRASKSSAVLALGSSTRSA
ncbi:HEPN domain-containing protein, partial [Aquabacterium humicola]|uniref:ApeA N-terminal domain 1-containing protein n=1 Tax=Aquabacterium humicola TaxID=3237377 RepID=UPI002543D436